MGSMFKRQRTCNDIIEDGINSLPDSVLTHILSFLPTKFLVPTCVLSHQWKDQWRSVTDLNFDDTLFKEPSFDLNPNHERLTFMDFIDKVLINRDNSFNINKFSVCCSRQCKKNRRLDKWVNLAKRQNVKEIILDFDIGERFCLPKLIFRCETLVILKLYHDVMVELVPSDIISLPNLKILHFCEVSIAEYVSVQTIINGCPLLEELMLRKCKWLMGKECWWVPGSGLRIIGLPFLKKLILDWTINAIDGDNEIVVDVPSLEYLELKDCTFDKFTMLNLGSFVHAKIDLSHKLKPFIYIPGYGERVLELLQGISNIRSLSLSETTMEVLNDAGINNILTFTNNFPKFINLTRLDLHADELSRWSILPEILACLPILETLVFSEGLVKNILLQHVPSWFNWSPPENVPNCLLFHLKEIKIKEFRGVQNELIIIKYFMENALVLKRIVIYCHLFRTHYDITEKLQNLVKGSRGCSIIPRSDLIEMIFGD